MGVLLILLNNVPLEMRNTGLQFNNSISAPKQNNHKKKKKKTVNGAYVSDNGWKNLLKNFMFKNGLFDATNAVKNEIKVSISIAAME